MGNTENSKERNQSINQPINQSINTNVAPDKVVFSIKSVDIFLISPQKHILCTHETYLTCFHGKIRKILFLYTLLSGVC